MVGDESLMLRGGGVLWPRCWGRAHLSPPLPDWEPDNLAPLPGCSHSSRTGSSCSCLSFSYLQNANSAATAPRGCWECGDPSEQRSSIIPQPSHTAVSLRNAFIKAVIYSSPT